MTAGVVTAGVWFVQRGSHRVFKHPDKQGIVVVAGRPGVDMPQGTWHNVMKQAGLRKRD